MGVSRGTRTKEKCNDVHILFQQGFVQRFLKESEKIKIIIIFVLGVQKCSKRGKTKFGKNLREASGTKVKKLQVWADYWSKVYKTVGERIGHYVHPYKTLLKTPCILNDYYYYEHTYI